MKTEKFCTCCGRKNSTIMKFLKKQKAVNRVKTWKSHRLFNNGDSFYNSNLLSYCENCGEKLDDEDINQVSESRGEYWGAPCSEMVVTGYSCSKCGYEEEF